MSRLLLVVWIAVFALSVGSLGFAAREYSRARAQARTDLSQLNMITPQIREIAALRAAAPTWAKRSQPDTALAPAAAAVVASCGLPAAALSNVSPDAQTRMGEGQFTATRQRATITLTGLTLPEVGRFMEAWRTAEPDWTIASVDLAPQQRASVTPGRDLPLRAIIVIEALYVQMPQNPRPPHTFSDRTGGKP